MDLQALKSKGKHGTSTRVAEGPRRLGLLERLFQSLSQEPWRGRLMSLMKLFGYRDEQWIRVVMGRETRDLVESIDSEHTQVLEISGGNWQNYFPSQRYSSLWFPGFDICKSATVAPYDLIVLEQVLEHVVRPSAALSNIEASLTASGHLLLTTPFMVRYHGHPQDCSRWTEAGLRNMLLDAGFDAEQIQTGSWGNKPCLLANLSVWQRYNPYIHSLNNDPRYPLMVWALARKSQGETGNSESAEPKVKRSCAQSNTESEAVAAASKPVAA